MDYMQMLAAQLKKQNTPPPGATVTGYKTVKTPNVGKAAEGSTHSTKLVPIYSAGAPAAATAPKPAPAPAPAPSVQAQDPVPLFGAGGGMMPMRDPSMDALLAQLSGLNDKLNQPQPLKITTAASNVGGNATGFSRKQSAARKAGLTTRGTARLRINRTGQTSASSGLNIGV